ncbi:glycosyltransferase family 4 protein [Oceanicella actignis]|uniref:Glycosyltransferase involved in cell wall bisynthesis n=1 Tax=Oceanicella actignis TaxID=1189325 RepID=A0A1M7U0X4_9RHOB|nr:glycosyltransferase family 4 protein [Oceanicella actignis]SET85783.1 Glycosyltransferase involved in cell wall bisynthesis [Oceanicella actignis]SHN76625.1 Glycosyltransferase involved in cell wall bisynthesis [Oceanicella actignis]
MSGACIISPGGRGGVGGIQSYARMIAARLEADHPDRPVAVLDPRGPRAWTWPLWTLWAAARLTALALGGKAAVAHLQASERSSLLRKGLLALLARALGMRVVMHHHGAELIPFARALPRPLRAALSWTLRRADENVVLGAVWARFLIEEMGVRPARVTVLPNALEDAPGASARTPDAPARPLRILFLAVMTRRKGARTLLEALARLSAEGVAWEATIAGGGPDLAPCRELAVRLGLGGRVRFAGMVDADEAQRLMRWADVYVCASSHEGLPIAILEALRAGTPVLTTPVGAIPEGAPEGRGALHFPVGDDAALARLLAGLASDRARLAALGRAARALFEERYELGRHMARLRALYGWEKADAPSAIAG